MEKKSAETLRRERKIYEVTIVGSIANLLLLVFKFVAGIVGQSAAMLADAVHSLSDFVTDVVVLLFVRLSNKPQDADHDYGHGKYETLATAIIGMVLLGVGLGILLNGGTAIWDFLHGKPLESPGMVAFVAAVLSIVVKEVLYQYTVRSGRSLRSQAVVANAWHHRSDALSSIGTGLGIGGAILLGADWRVLDPIAAVVVSIFIIKVSVQLLLPCLDDLLEKSLPAAEERRIEEIILGFEGVSQPHNLRTRRIGNRCSVEVHIRVNGELTVSRSHEITRGIERSLRAELGEDTFVNIHVEPEK